MKTQNRYFIYLIMFSVTCLSGVAQESTYSKVFQLSFVPPISSNGPQSGETTNMISLNLISGYSHGVGAVEVGGIYNVVRSDVNGAQFGGLGNTVGGEVHGLQVAGLINTSAGYVEGAQIGGLINITRESIKGVQIGGFTNIASAIKGWQIGGFNNHSKQTDGVQIGGFINTSEEVKGLQLAGFINIAKKVKGVQLGVVNVADSLESGMQIGVVNISKNGFISPGVESDDVIPLRFVFRSGKDAFYTILSAGIKGDDYWSYGGGIGSKRFFSSESKVFLNPEMRYHQITKRKSSGSNHLMKMNLNLGYQLFSNLYITAGPTFNFYTTNLLDQNDQPVINIASNPSHESQVGKFKNQFWIGYSIGIGF